MRIFGNVSGSDVSLSRDLKVSGNVISDTVGSNGPMISSQTWGPTTNESFIPFSVMFRGASRASGTLTIRCAGQGCMAVGTCSILLSGTAASLIVTSQHTDGNMQLFRISPVSSGSSVYDNQNNVGLSDETDQPSVKVETIPGCSVCWSCVFAT